MIELNKLHGIVLRTYASGDSDLVVRILTQEEGKIAAIAKQNRSTKRTSSASIDVFDCGQFELKRGRGPLRLIKGFTPDRPMHHLRENLDVLTLASVACEVTDILHLEDGGPMLVSYEALANCLSQLSSRSSLKENCAVLFHGLGELLGDAGFLDTSALGRGSRDALVRLMSEAEKAAEKELKTKSSLLELVGRLG